MLVKVFKYVLLFRSYKYLSTNDQQFDYKQQNSTLQCTWVANETISYYNSMKFGVCCCLLGCTEAFDSLEFIVQSNIGCKPGDHFTAVLVNADNIVLLLASFAMASSSPVNGWHIVRTLAKITYCLVPTSFKVNIKQVLNFVSLSCPNTIRCADFCPIVLNG